MHVVLRSAKHNPTGADTNVADILSLYDLDSFRGYLLRFDQDTTKPIFILTCDNGPDETPRHLMTQRAMWRLFTDDLLDLDSLIVASYAAGISPKNPVEREMAFLTHPLCGIVLDHKKFGGDTHAKGETVDEEIEKKKH